MIAEAIAGIEPDPIPAIAIVTIVGMVCPLIADRFFCDRSVRKGYFSLNAISMRGQRATGKIQRNNHHHGSCGLL